MIGELAALSSSAVWALASLLFTELGKSIRAAALNLMKGVIAIVMLLATLWVLEGSPWPTGIPTSDALWLVASGFVGITVGDTAFFQALRRIGPRKSLLLLSLAPLITALLGWPVLGEPVSPVMLFGMALTMGGVSWVIRERAVDATPDEEGRLDERAGVAFGLLAALCQAVGNILVRLGGAEASPLAVSAVRIMAGCVGLIVSVVIARQAKDIWSTLRTPRRSGLLVVATFLGTYLGIWLMNIGLLNAPVAVASTLNSTSPIFVLPLVAFISRESVSPRAIVGALIAVGGVALLTLT